MFALGTPEVSECTWALDGTAKLGWKIEALGFSEEKMR